MDSILRCGRFWVQETKMPADRAFGQRAWEVLVRGISGSKRHRFSPRVTSLRRCTTVFCASLYKTGRYDKDPLQSGTSVEVGSPIACSVLAALVVFLGLFRLPTAGRRADFPPSR